MSENKDFDAIMREITSGFTGNPTQDDEVKKMLDSISEQK